VGAETPLGLLDDHLALKDREAQVLQAIPEHEVASELSLTLANSAANDLDDLEVAFHLCCGFGIEAVGANLRHHEVAQDSKAHPGLAQRWENLFDVGQEQAIRSQHKDTLILKRESVGVEQIRRAVKRHDRLAGARATLDHKEATKGSSNYLVLLALDRRDDVSKAARAGGLESGNECAMSLNFACGGLFVEAAEIAEELVVDIEKRAAAGGEVTSPIEA